ncbi:MAG: hypothetical protein K4H23_03110 [Mollicutes bacterium PWAP]|nr:hypothetical protein [Mollicutes bacterium PWAP]
MLNDKISKLDKIHNETISELGRSDAKFRNIGTVSALLISALVSSLIAVLYHTSGDTQLIIVSIVSLFIFLNISSICISVYAVWPRKRYTHSVYDIEYLTNKNNLEELNYYEKFSEKRIKEMIILNARRISQKRKFLTISMFLCVFPISLIFLFIINKKDSKKRNIFIRHENEIKIKKSSKK